MQLKTWDKVLIGSILVSVIWLFGYGVLSGIKDCIKKVNLLEYAIKSEHMEPISGFGYRLYFELFTDLPEKRKEMKDFADELEKFGNINMED